MFIVMFVFTQKHFDYFHRGLKTLKPYIFNEYILCTQIVVLAGTRMKVVPKLRDIQTYTVVNDKKSMLAFRILRLGGLYTCCIVGAMWNNQLMTD